jgi:phospholipid/cholesterol/gamma-HCH transport system substrate-binding protein
VNGLRHTDEWVGILVVAAVLVFLGAILEAGLLRDWFRPVGRLRIVLPQSGVGGLSVGADVDVLGIHSGTVRRIVLSPNQQIYAVADIDEQAEPFIRRDSQAVIRRSFGVVGAAYVDISRGAGAPLDWSYAVIQATTERAATDTISGMIDELRQRIFPVLDDAKRTMESVAAVTDNLREGHGTVGRLLTDDTLAVHAEQTVQAVQEQVTALSPLIARLDEAAKQANAVLQLAASDKEGLPNLTRRADEVLQSLESAARDALPVIADTKRTMDSIVTIADNLRDGHGTLGRLLADDTLARGAERTIQALQEQIAALSPVIARLDDAAKQTDELLQLAASGKEGVPNLIRRTDAMLQSLQSAARDVSRATPYLPEITKNVAGGTTNLPALLTQTQLAAAELERVLTQLRGSWLLGGGGAQPPPNPRLPSTRVQP